MSTNYKVMKNISFAELFDGRLAQFEIRERIVEEKTSATTRCLTDGCAHFWVYADNDTVDRLNGCSCGPHEPILTAIGEAFDTSIYTENEPQYWGFETQGEWDLAERKREDEQNAEIAAELVKCIKGEPNYLQVYPLTLAEVDIGKDLIDNNPELATPEKSKELMESIKIKAYLDYHDWLDGIPDTCLEA